MKEPPQTPRPVRLRRLSDEEIDLWIAVAKSVSRRKGAKLPNPRKIPPPPVEAMASSSEPEKRRASPAPKAPSPPPLAPLERRLKKQLARGRSAIDQSIDLHGMTQAQAHQALRGFLIYAQAQGDRLVLVVTGKGAPKVRAFAPNDFDEPGILRRLVPHWLQASDMRAIVLGFEEAGRAHGGSGALYVRLRRSERMGGR
ncbi:Smr/MutS family protein [Methylocapsa sp. S129]|uniref:Smr/MutS family protein n=1 Tax=Methylocapsa sp. S129 TaxID=1641869 RepID=UPI00131E0EBE|nr:Smr/MutS family protein [Methylocapsa sp. S129]